MASSSDAVIEEGANRILEGILDPHQFAPNGIRHLIDSLPTEVLGHLFPTDNGTSNGEPPLRVHDLLLAACDMGNLEAVVWLLFYGANPSIRGQRGTPLEVATQKGNVEMVEKLIDWNTDVLGDQNEILVCLQKACEGQHRDLLQFWLGHLNNICLYQPAWSNFTKASTGNARGFNPRFPKPNILQFPDAILQALGDTTAQVLETWVTLEDEEADKKRLGAHWNNKNLLYVEAGWLQRPQYHPNLVSINLSQNAITSIPAYLLWNMPYLEYLDVSRNKIVTLPPKPPEATIEQLGMRTLKLSNNSLTTIPNEVFMMPQLELLLLSRNCISTIGLDQQQGATARKPEWRCTNLQELNLSYNNLTSVPRSLSAACRMKRLDLSNNELTEMPTPWHCPMEILSVSNNQITQTSIQDLHHYWRQSLRILHLANNRLGGVPTTVCRLTVLQILNLSATMITELPNKEDWKTFCLTQLDISHNNLGNECASQKRWFRRPDDSRETRRELEFPEFFRTNLQVLHLNNTSLHMVPDAVCELRALQYLDLKGNPNILRLPDHMALLRNLTKLKVDYEQIREPTEVTETLLPNRENRAMDPTKNVKAILRERFLKYEACKEIKLVLLGPTQSGKTELLSCLTGCGWPIPDSGVNVVNRTSLNLPRRHMPEQNISYSLWDMKGGDDFLVIHQAFLTPRTIYLLVWDIRQRSDADLRKLEPYILNIQARAPSCPIIAVATHTDKYLAQRGVREKITTESRQAFLRNFPEVTVNFVEVDARQQSGYGISDLKLMIYNCATTLTYMQRSSLGRRVMVTRRLLDREVPKSFIHLKNRLSTAQMDQTHMLMSSNELNESTSTPRQQPPFMTEADLANLIKDFPDSHIETTEEIEEVVAFLQDCGTLLHFRDYTSKLTRLYFLDPVWLCDTLVSVGRLQNDDPNAHEGIVRDPQLRELCKESGFGETRYKEYIQLLARFEIALSTSRHRPDSLTVNAAQTYVIPSALPRKRPAMEHIGRTPYGHTLMRWYRMAYVPPGFWSRLVARLLVSFKQNDRFSIQLEHVQTFVSQEGMNIHHDTGQIKVGPMRFPTVNNREDPGLRITLLISKDGNFSPLGFVIDHIEKLIKDWYPGLTGNRQNGSPSVSRLIPCPMCEEGIRGNQSIQKPVSEYDLYHIFPFDVLISALANGRDFIECPRHQQHAVSLRRLAPDLFLTDLDVEHLEKDELTEGQLLGKGSYGEVHKAKYRDQFVAMKSLRNNKPGPAPTDSSSSSSSSSASCATSFVSSRPTPSLPASNARLNSINHPAVSEQSPEVLRMHSIIKTFPKFRSEVRMMSRLDHPCVLKLVGVSVQRLSIAMELAPSPGDLYTYVDHVYTKKRNSFVLEKLVHECILPRSLTFKIGYQVASGIDYLHNLGVIHADIKTNNVLLFSTDPASSINIKLSDYGISQDLDLGGVRGDAARHAFCAPEITKGLAFDEKIDWFSFAMLLYHVISGTLPFLNTTCLDTIARVTRGSRPDLQYYNYTMRPQFPQMEGLMKACWQENPDQRPSGKEILADMQDPSFLCLRQSKLLERTQTAVSVIYTDRYQEGVDDKQTCHAYAWHADGHVMDHNMFTGHNGQVIRVAKPNESHITCATTFDGLHMIGRSNRTIETHSFIKNRLVLQPQVIVVPTHPTAMYYHRCAGDDEERKSGKLYVGLEDGMLVIYKHQPQSDVPWGKPRTLVLCVEPAPCLCIEPAEERNEIWISCGSTLRCMMSDGLLDPTCIFVSSPEQASARGNVHGLCYSNGSIWCFVGGCHQIIRYDAESRLLQDCFYCGYRLQRSDYRLPNLITTTDAVTEPVASPEDHDVTEPGESPEAPNGEIPPMPTTYSASVPAKSYFPRDSGNEDRLTMSEGQHPTEDHRTKVTSILVVKDTLWVGRDQGDILVVNKNGGDRSNHQIGEVLAVLTSNPIQGIPKGIPKGSTYQMHYLGNNSVLEFQHINDGQATRPFRYHLLRWENWGTEEVKQAKELMVISPWRGDPPAAPIRIPSSYTTTSGSSVNDAFIVNPHAKKILEQEDIQTEELSAITSSEKGSVFAPGTVIPSKFTETGSRKDDMRMVNSVARKFPEREVNHADNPSTIPWSMECPEPVTVFPITNSHDTVSIVDNTSIVNPHAKKVHEKEVRLAEDLSAISSSDKEPAVATGTVIPGNRIQTESSMREIKYVDNLSAIPSSENGSIVAPSIAISVNPTEAGPTIDDTSMVNPHAEKVHEKEVFQTEDLSAISKSQKGYVVASVTVDPANSADAESIIVDTSKDNLHAKKVNEKEVSQIEDMSVIPLLNEDPIEAVKLILTTNSTETVSSRIDDTPMEDPRGQKLHEREVSHADNLSSIPSSDRYSVVMPDETVNRSNPTKTESNIYDTSIDNQHAKTFSEREVNHADDLSVKPSSERGSVVASGTVIPAVSTDNGASTANTSIVNPQAKKFHENEFGQTEVLSATSSSDNGPVVTTGILIRANSTDIESSTDGDLTDNQHATKFREREVNHAGELPAKPSS